ncbi:hypothetical protein PybrP1_007795 [[Pythium] brassicae (nom. inval.)]|nr:hypothetical protein PybrP1_007795 [[Pythium] brassicae (nom. inval.)]
MLGQRSLAFARGAAAAQLRVSRRFLSVAGAAKTDAGSRLVKRKVAIVAGYSGSGFSGVQLNENVHTIEHELRDAVFRAGAIRESNFEDLTKIDWSRSSRTDKGVHAGCIVFSAKLLIDEENVMDPATGRVRGLAEALNASLPPTIRVFSCTRVNKRFDARKNCVLREYEYFMPLSLLERSVEAAGNRTDVDAAVDEFCRAVQRYQGVHDFHNFTKARSHFYKEHARIRDRRATDERDPEAAEAVDDSDGDDDNDDSDDSDDNDSDDATASPGVDAASQFEDAQATARKALPRHRRSVYACSASLVPDFCGQPFLRVHVVGQAFLFNQIRCMIGGALAVASQGISRTMFDAALNTNRIVRVPVAPAEGLVLLSSSFGGKLHTVSLFEDPNTVLAKERRDLSHRVLLSRAEDKAMTAFREDVLYTEVAAAWANDGDELARWRTYLERVLESNAHLADDELAAALERVEASAQEQQSKRLGFVQQNRINYVNNNVKGGLLPRQFTTKLCVRFAVAPGIFTSDLRRAVTMHIKSGKLNLESTETEILDYIARYGVDRMAEEGRKQRLSIRT